MVENLRPPTAPPRNVESELDALLEVIQERQQQEILPGDRVTKPIDRLRELMVKELVPVFVELSEKYGKSGMSMQMDASNLLSGGREVRFEFGIGGHRSELQGTVTSDAIAFHEVRFSPDIHGQLLAGPMLRLKTLSANTFREFICERLTMVLRLAARRK